MNVDLEPGIANVEGTTTNGEWDLDSLLNNNDSNYTSPSPLSSTSEFSPTSAYGSEQGDHGSPESSFGVPSPTQPYNTTSQYAPQPTAVPIDPVNQLWACLNQGRLPVGTDTDATAFLDAMSMLIYQLSTQQEAVFGSLVHKHHPDERVDYQMYLGKGTKKQGIAKSKNKKNFVKFGGKIYTHSHATLQARSLYLEYMADSPPEELKQSVVRGFWLGFGEIEKTAKRKKATPTETPPEILHKDLRIFIAIPSKNPHKRKLAGTQQQDPSWTPRDNTLFANSNVAVDGNVQAKTFFATEALGLSDRTTKENIRPVTGGSLTAIDAIRVYDYNHTKEYGNADHTTRGPMAQELQQILPDAVSEIKDTNGKYDGKLAVNHNAVLYTTIGAIQDLSRKVKCLSDSMAIIEAGDNVKRAIRAVSNSLPQPEQLPSDPVQHLIKEKLLREGDTQGSQKRINLGPTVDVLAKCLRGARRIYERQLGISKSPEQEAEEDRVEEEREKGLTQAQKLKRIEELLDEGRAKRAEVNRSWEIQCDDCESPICDLSQFHFYYSNESSTYHMVSDVGVTDWKGSTSVKAHTGGESNMEHDLSCECCGTLIGHIAQNRGKGSPKPEIILRKIKFVNTKNNTSLSFKLAEDAYAYFSERLAVERRETTIEDQLAEAREAEERKIASFPETTRIRVRGVQQQGGAPAKGAAIMCKRRDKVQNLIEAVRKEIPDVTFDGLFLNDDCLDVIDPNKFVNEVLMHDDTVYYGIFPQNETIINLRKYQAELMRRAVTQNCVVVCPTGSGKTAVAVEVERTLRSTKNGLFKTVMVVRDLPLSVQQYNYFLQNSRKQRVNLVNSEHPLIQTWEEMLKVQDIVVLTAQVLLNNLELGRAHLSNIDLLILDEAHHTAKNHPFNKIMRDHYFKLPKEQRPKVLALTASPPAHLSLERTKELIQDFEKGTDCKIILVDEYKADLRKDISIPVTIIHPIVPSPYEKHLLSLLTKAMDNIEKTKKMEEDEATERAVLRGSPEYDKFCNLAELQFLNLVLMSLNDEGDPEALLRAKEDEYASVKKILSGLDIVHDKTKARTEILLRTLGEFKDVPNFRGIVFVATKQGGEQICKVIKERGLTFIKPHRFFGHSDKNGLAMSSGIQQKVIDQFKSGEVNLLVATSVAEEGLDLTACNVVFRYDSVYSHRSLIQTRGRARQKDSKFIIFYLEKSPAEVAWHASVTKLKNMLIALGENLSDSPFMSTEQHVLNHGTFF